MDKLFKDYIQVTVDRILYFGKLGGMTESEARDIEMVLGKSHYADFVSEEDKEEYKNFMIEALVKGSERKSFEAIDTDFESENSRE